MALILSIETATPVCSVALHDNGKLLALQELHLQKSHSEYLAVLIRETMKYAGLALEELNFIALSKGPGSYTGLRIGTATAKGLCYSLDIPLISVNTLEAMAHGAKKYLEKNVLMCPMIDARRMEVYSLIVDSDMKIIEPTRPVVVTEEAYQTHLEQKPFYFFGDGAEKCIPLLSKWENARFIEEVKPTAKCVGALASERVSHNQHAIEDLAYFEPFYLKDFKAKTSSKNLSV